MSNNKQRIRWIDFSKAICIYFVVLGHALSYYEINECRFRNFIYLFHLPVFFFISGYLFRIKEKEKTPLSYFLSNTKSLIVPYVFLNVLAIFLNFPHFLHHSSSELYYFIIGHGHAPAGPAWFLLCLFWIKIQMYFISRFNGNQQMIIALFYAFFAYYFPWHLYWDIDASFMAMPIFILGYIVKKSSVLSGVINKHYSALMLISLIIISFVATYYLSLIQNKEAMFSRLFGTYGALFYVGAFFGIVMIIVLCRLLEGFSNKYISTISSGSIIIMGLHGIFYRYTISIFNKLSILTKSELNIPYKVLICLIVLAEMYIPIIILQKYCSQFLGGRKT